MVTNQGGTVQTGRGGISSSGSLLTNDRGPTTQSSRGGISSSSNILTNDRGPTTQNGRGGITASSSVVLSRELSSTLGLRPEGITIGHNYNTKGNGITVTVTLFLPVYKSTPTSSVTYYRMEAYNTITNSIESWTAIGAPNNSNPSGQPIQNVRIAGKWIINQ